MLLLHISASHNEIHPLRDSQANPKMGEYRFFRLKIASEKNRGASDEAGELFTVKIN